MTRTIYIAFGILLVFVIYAPCAHLHNYEENGNKHKSVQEKHFDGTCNETNVCDNGGECMISDEYIRFCNCKLGTKGDKCELIADCEDEGFCGANEGVQKCKYDGIKGGICVCEDSDKSFDPAAKECRKTCDEINVCWNGAECKDVEGGNPNVKFCHCRLGTKGDQCEIIEACEDKEFCGTKDDVHCQYDGKNGGICACLAADKLFDPISKKCRKTCKEMNVCFNGGICMASKHGDPDVKFCNCDLGFEGDQCETFECENPEFCGTKLDVTCRYDYYKGSICECNDSRKLFDPATKECRAKFCVSNPCTDGSECVFDEETRSTVCECKDRNKYYDYSMKICREPDKCVLKESPCRENSICLNGNCVCNKNFRDQNGTCVPDICISKPCFPGAICNDIDGNLKCTCEEGMFFDGSKCSDAKCFLGDFKKTCGLCPSNFRKENNECRPKERYYTECSENCGYGYCLQKQNQSYTCSCIRPISDNYKNKPDGKCILIPNVVCASKILTNDLTKCNCTGKYKLAGDGITCEQKTCLDQSAQDDCEQKGAQCITDRKLGYICKCWPGYIFNGNMCTDLCSLERNKRVCLMTDQFCYNSQKSLNGETADCQCPPLLKMGYGFDNTFQCVDIAENVYVITGIPVLKAGYLMGDKINYVLLNSHLISSMKSTFTHFDYGYLHDYQLNGDVLIVTVWIQFKNDPDSELNRIPLQTRSFECDGCNSDLSLWPPYLLMDKELMDGVRYERLEFCSEISKNNLCGKEAICENNECSCPRGYKTLEYSIRYIKGKFRIEHCEDIDECATGVHRCGINTTCFNELGDYSCQCKPNYKKLDTGHFSINGDKGDCYFDHCASNPCKNGGSCRNREDTFECTCTGIYGGKDCSENIWCERYGKYLCGKEMCQYNETLGRGNCECEGDKVFNEALKICVVDHCISNPCKNEGSCRNTEDTFECMCIGNYRGYDCSENIWCDKHGHDLCGKEKCQYNETLDEGVCQCEYGQVFHEPSKTCIDSNTYTCSFYYWRVNWQTAVRTCESEDKQLLCYKSKKEIHDITESFMLSGFERGSLKLWLSKTNCSRHEMEECLSLHIQKHGETVWHYFQHKCEDEAYPFICCANGLVDHCASNPCKNGGSCQNGKVTFECTCTDNYGGKNCSENIWCDKYGQDFCGKEKCQYNETLGKGYCVCADNKVFNETSKACVDPCTPNPCHNGGTCMIYGTVPKCACEMLYSGSTCDIDNRFITASILSILVVVFLMFSIMICIGCCLLKINQKLKVDSRNTDTCKTPSNVL